MVTRRSATTKRTGGLVINQREAEIVRHIFRRYLELGSVYALHAELEREGFLTKITTSRSGRTRGGRPFSRGALFHMLRNRLYLGEIVHKDTCYPGLHPAIVDQELFDAVQSSLASRRTTYRKREASKAPLAGILFDALGNRMAATHARGRGGRRYLYYLSPVPTSHPEAERILRRVPAPAIEEIVVDRLRTWGERPGAGWSDLLPYVKRVQVHREAIILDVTPPPHERWAIGMSEHCSGLTDGVLRVTSPVTILARGGKTSLIDAATRPVRSCPDRVLIASLRRAHAELASRGIGLLHPDSSIESARGVDDPYLRKLTRLAFLAPDIQRAILEGRHPRGLLLARELPLSWDEQRATLGFA